MHLVFDPVNKALRRVPAWWVYVVGALPFAWMAWRVVNGTIGVDPVAGIEWALGLWAMRFLLATLAVTPLRWLGLNLVRFRRQLGLLAFYYTLMHIAVWVLLYMGMEWGQIFHDLFLVWFILYGTLSTLLLLPLALTSNDWSVRRMGGKQWNRVHKLVYPAAILAMLHFSLVAKVYTNEMLTYAAILTGLLVWRLVKVGPRRMVLA